MTLKGGFTKYVVASQTNMISTNAQNTGGGVLPKYRQSLYKRGFIMGDLEGCPSLRIFI